MSRRPLRTLIATLAAAAVAAPLLFTGAGAVPTVGASFTDAASADVATVRTSSLPPLTSVNASATRNTNGEATLTWSAPTGLQGREISYSLHRTVGDVTTPLSPLGSGTSLTDDLTVTPNSFYPRGVTRLGVGSYHTCVLSDGVPYCWGHNDVGQLGSGTSHDSSTPQAVDTSGVLAGKAITALDSGSWHTCVIADGAPYCWGLNRHGALGLGEGTIADPHFSNIPVAVDTSGVLRGKTVTHLSTGLDRTCVLADGAPYCWGYQHRGSLGHGDTEDRDDKPWPVAVHLTEQLQGKTLVDITVGGSHACVRTSDGMAFCWGDHARGQLGIGQGGNAAPYPLPVRATGWVQGGYLEDVTSISAGLYNTCAYARKPTDTAQKVYCWGLYLSGDKRWVDVPGTGVSSVQQPTEIDLSGAPSLAADGASFVIGGSVNCAVARTRTAAWCWGEGQRGELGDGGQEDRLEPTMVAFSQPGYITAIDHGVAHSCALKGYQVICWGTNYYGAVGVNDALLLTPNSVPITNAALGIPRCESGWRAVNDERCAPGQSVPVSYQFGYSVNGWSSPTTSSVPAQWVSTP